VRRVNSPDRLRWNAKYAARTTPSFSVHPLAARALAPPLPDGPVLDLACGLSGDPLSAAEAGRAVTAVDVSDVALERLDAEVRRRGLEDRITLVHADLLEWRPPPSSYAAVRCFGYWDRELFGPAAAAVLPGGALAWEAFTEDARRHRPLPAAWCLAPGEPASLLPEDFTVLDVTDEREKRRILARRDPAL
jgi:SAM-dependent methyltransferase